MAGPSGSGAIGYPLMTADDRQVPHVVAQEWPSGGRLFENHPVDAGHHLGGSSRGAKSVYQENTVASHAEKVITWLPP